MQIEIDAVLPNWMIILDRIVAKLFPVRKSFMQCGNSHQCTVNKRFETFTTDDDNVFSVLHKDVFDWPLI